MHFLIICFSTNCNCVYIHNNVFSIPIAFHIFVVFFYILRSSDSTTNIQRCEIKSANISLFENEKVEKRKMDKNRTRETLRESERVRHKII